LIWFVAKNGKKSQGKRVVWSVACQRRGRLNLPELGDSTCDVTGAGNPKTENGGGEGEEDQRKALGRASRRLPNRSGCETR